MSKFLFLFKIDTKRRKKKSMKIFPSVRVEITTPTYVRSQNHVMDWNNTLWGVSSSSKDETKLDFNKRVVGDSKVNECKDELGVEVVFAW